MASISRLITTTGRPLTTTNKIWLTRALSSPHPRSRLLRTYYDNRQPITSLQQSAPDTLSTRHATTNIRSRDDIRARNVGWSSLKPRQTFKSQVKRYLSTSPRNFNAAKQEGTTQSTSHSKIETNPQIDTSHLGTNTNKSEATTIPSPLLTLKSLKPTTHENIYTLPNLLTTTRIITAPIISYALLHGQPLLAFGLFAYSSLTDLIDGYLARNFGSSTVLGSILDPFADKLLMTLTTITLFYTGVFPWWLTLTILGRDAGLLLSALYFRWISLPPPRTMTRYWDFSLPSAEVRPTEISKINTMLQFLLVAGAVGIPVVPEGIVEAWNLWGVLEGWMGLVAGTTIWSGASYIFSRDAIRFIGRDGEEGEKKE